MISYVVKGFTTFHTPPDEKGEIAEWNKSWMIEVTSVLDAKRLAKVLQNTGFGSAEPCIRIFNYARGEKPITLSLEAFASLLDTVMSDNDLKSQIDEELDEVQRRREQIAKFRETPTMKSFAELAKMRHDPDNDD